MSEIKVNKISPVSVSGTTLFGDSGDTFTIPSGATFSNLGTATGFGGGGVLQLKHTEFTATASSTTADNTFSTNYFSVTITPTLATSKILILANVNCGMGNNNYNMGIRLVRDTTVIGSTPDSPSARTVGFCGTRIEIHNQRSLSINYLDAPASTSALVYGIQGTMQASGTALYINRTGNDTDDKGYGRNVSHITAVEIAACIL